MSGSTDSSTPIAMVALNSSRMPDGARVLATLRERFPDSPVPSRLREDARDMLSFRIGDAMAVVSLVPGPIPWPDLEGPCATAWWWPEATVGRSEEEKIMVRHKPSMWGRGTVMKLEF
jgi:hypothetical protein